MITRAFGRRFLYDARLVWSAVIVGLFAGLGCDTAPLLGPINSRITLTVSNRVLPTGGSATLTATVLENSGSPVPNGTSVRFLTSLGRVDPAEATTSNGVATATFFAGDTSGTAQIQALSGLAQPGAGSGTGGTGGGAGAPAPTSTAGNVVEITIGAAAANGITLSANPSTVRPSGSTAEIEAFVTATNGQALPNVPVSFSTTRGTVIPSVANTDANGVARTTLTASEAATVTARVGQGGTGQTATLEVRASTVASFTLATTPSSPAAGQPVSLTITPAQNTAPRVVVNWGDTSNPQDLGIVSAARSVTHTYAAPGFYNIEATGTSADGETFTNAIPVTVAQQPPVGLIVNPTSGPLSTNFTFTITPTTGALIQNITIAYGDGQQDTLGAISSQTTRQHRYNSPGTYTATVTQTETTGNVTFASVTVTVSP